MTELDHQSKSFGRFFIEEINSEEEDFQMITEDLFDSLIHKKPIIPINSKKEFTYKEITNQNNTESILKLEIMETRNQNFIDFREIWNKFSLLKHNLKFNYPNLNQECLEINSTHSDYRNDFRSHIQKARKGKLCDGIKNKYSTNLDSTHLNSNSESNYLRNKSKQSMTCQTELDYQYSSFNYLIIENNAFVGIPASKEVKILKKGKTKRRNFIKQICSRKKSSFNSSKKLGFSSNISPVKSNTPLPLTGKICDNSTKDHLFFNFLDFKKFEDVENSSLLKKENYDCSLINDPCLNYYERINYKNKNIH